MENKGHKVLIADDEPDILEILKYNLVGEGYEVITAKDGDEALEKARRTQPDLVILDVMMPKKTGVEVCQLLRAQPAFKETLIIFLTAVNDEGTQIRGLETGADDYVSKPVSPKVFMSRVNALFRRLNKKEVKTLRIENLTIDPERFIVQVGDSDIILAKKEFELLYLLAQNLRSGVTKPHIGLFLFFPHRRWLLSSPASQLILCAPSRALTSSRDRQC